MQRQNTINTCQIVLLIVVSCRLQPAARGASYPISHSLLSDRRAGHHTGAASDGSAHYTLDHLGTCLVIEPAEPHSRLFGVCVVPRARVQSSPLVPIPQLWEQCEQCEREPLPLGSSWEANGLAAPTDPGTSFPLSRLVRTILYHSQPPKGLCGALALTRSGSRPREPGNLDTSIPGYLASLPPVLISLKPHTISTRLHPAPFAH